MRLPRMTTRRWMIAVAFVAAMMGWFALQRRAEQFQRLAASHGREAEVFRNDMDMGISDPALIKRLDYHEEMRRKYDRGVLYPWLLVAPDPPKPKLNYTLRP